MRMILAVWFAVLLVTSASALTCAQVDEANSRIDVAKTKAEVVNALRFLHPISDELARAIYGSFTEVDEPFRERMKGLVERVRPGCTK